MIDQFFASIAGFFTPERLRQILRIVSVLVFGTLGVRLLAGLVSRIFKRRVTAQTAMVVRKVIFYVGTTVIVLAVLQQLGLKLGALLGAAGIVGIAVGFAAQTSLSNLISGIFLLSEKPFQVGDFISVGTTSGIIQSVDLLSVKVRTHANLFIRIPNSKLIDTEMTNVTYYPIRRMDFTVGVAYKEEPGRVMAVLADIARNNPWVLDEPGTLILFQNLGESALEFLFAVWFQKSDFIKVRNSVLSEVKNRFDREGIEIPFPHRTLYTGAATNPFPIRIVGEDEESLKPPADLEINEHPPADDTHTADGEPKSGRGG